MTEQPRIDPIDASYILACSKTGWPGSRPVFSVLFPTRRKDCSPKVSKTQRWLYWEKAGNGRVVYAVIQEEMDQPDAHFLA